MIRFTLPLLWPKFILNDKNGYAMARALEAGLNYFLERAGDALKIWHSVEDMPEWRLDELAHELNCLYDYTADVEAKRRWIRDAIPLYAIYGTPRAIVDFLEGYFDSIEVEESWQYGGEPFHFRVTLNGEWTDDKERWARRAIETTKNVRSVMDTLAAGAGCDIEIGAAEDGVFRFPYGMTGATTTGTKPQANIVGIAEDGADVALSADAEGWPFTYPMTGTRPQANIVGIAEENAGAELDAAAEEYPFAYHMTGETEATGTHPDVATLGATAENAVEAEADEDTAFTIPYKMCGRTRL